jgi:ParB family chromosome partitioning protein
MSDSVSQDSSPENPFLGDHLFPSPASAEERVTHTRNRVDHAVPDQNLADRIERMNADFICPSSHANRSELEYETAEFSALKDTIEATGGNVQAIQVRPLLCGETPHPNFPQAQYVIVYGHRRHMACLLLELPVLTHVLQECEDEPFFQNMHHENRERKSLSAFEAGRFYESVMKSENISEQNKLAKLLRTGVSGICESLKVSRLPAEILDIFDSPLDLNIHDGPLLAREWHASADLMHERIASIRELKKRKKFTKTELVQLLLGKRSLEGESIRPSNLNVIEVIVHDEVVATVKTTSAGITNIKLRKKQLHDNDRLWIAEQLQSLFAEAPFLAAPMTLDPAAAIKGGA